MYAHVIHNQDRRAGNANSNDLESSNKTTTVGVRFDRKLTSSNSLGRRKLPATRGRNWLLGRIPHAVLGQQELDQ